MPKAKIALGLSHTISKSHSVWLKTEVRLSLMCPRRCSTAKFIHWLNPTSWWQRPSMLSIELWRTHGRNVWLMAIQILVLEDLGKKEEKDLSLHRLCHIQMIQHCMGKLFILSNTCAIGPCVRLMGIVVSPDLISNWKLKTHRWKLWTQHNWGTSLNSSDRSSTFCRIKVPHKPLSLPTGSTDLITVSNGSWFCQLHVLGGYLSLLRWWQQQLFRN